MVCRYYGDVATCLLLLVVVLHLPFPIMVCVPLGRWCMWFWQECVRSGEKEVTWCAVVVRWPCVVLVGLGIQRRLPRVWRGCVLAVLAVWCSWLGRVSRQVFGRFLFRSMGVGCWRCWGGVHLVWTSILLLVVGVVCSWQGVGLMGLVDWSSLGVCRREGLMC